MLPLFLLAAVLPASAASTSYDLAVGANGSVRSAAAGVARRHALLKEGRLLLGYGARATLATGTLELAPAVKDPGAGRLSVDSARLAMINANVHAAVKAAEPLELGFNLDLAGVGFGASESAIYRSHPGAAPVRVGASPARGNAFLFAYRDRGSLNSEFYAAWKLGPELTLRGGLSHLLTEYRTDADLGGGRRFRRFSNLVFLGLRWTPGR